MFHTRSKTNSEIAVHAQTRKGLLFGEVIVVTAVIVSLAFAAWRSNTAQWANLVPTFVEDHSVDNSVSFAGTTDTDQINRSITQLNDADPNVRVSAAEKLGSMQAVEATNALITATYDSNAHVREQATTALGQIGAIPAANRIRELEMIEGNSFVETAASIAHERILNHVAAVLDVPRVNLQTIAVAENGIAYAVVANDLYAQNENGAWFYVGHLPDAINDIAVGPDGTLYVATRSAGLHRSKDGGQTWEYMNFGLLTPTQLTTTALAVDPLNNERVYVALAVGAGDDNTQLKSVGISVSEDGGTSWLALENSPMWSVTRHLLVDHTTPGYLYGSADEGPWRYELPSNLAQPN